MAVPSLGSICLNVGLYIGKRLRYWVRLRLIGTIGAGAGQEGRQLSKVQSRKCLAYTTQGRETAKLIQLPDNGRREKRFQSADIEREQGDKW